MAIIPGLPEHLQVVPPAPSSRLDPEADAKRQAWKDWREEVLIYRLEHTEAVLSSPDLQDIEWELCARSKPYFITMWCWISEPRSGDGRSGGVFPWIPFEVQVELWNWIDERMASSGVEGDGVISKARDLGASWCMCGDDVHGWLFKQPYSDLLISRKEDLVDSKKSESLFWKLRFLIDSLPDFLRPAEYDRNNKDHSSKLTLINPENKNELMGESTNANSGRGSRTAKATFDEAAFIEGFLDIWAGIANTTYHRFALSSESLQVDTGFYKLTHAEDIDMPPPLFVMEWYHNPLNDDAWYQAMWEKMASTPGKFEAEVLRDPKAGDTTFIYPGSFNIELGEYEYLTGQPLWIAMDPGFGDQCALIWIAEDLIDGGFIILDSYERNAMESAFYGCIIAGHYQFLEHPDVQYPFAHHFTQHDYEFMEWTATLPKCAVVGDSYGDNVSGATADSWYDVLRRPPFNLRINADRTPSGETAANKKAVRQFKPRRDALRELLPDMKFANTPGAANVLRALQEHKFMEETGRTTTEQVRPKHDWTSHRVSALEFFAAYWKVRRDFGSNAKRTVERQKRDNARRPQAYNPYTAKGSSNYRSARSPYSRGRGSS